MKSKLLKKDYSEELEEICESKKFEKEAQNLLLSMFYKVEGAYNDYKTVKREVPEKEEFLQLIVDIVKKYCKEIEIAKPNSALEKELTVSRCKIVEEEPDNNYNNDQKVIFFPSEKVILYSIIKASLDKISPKLDIKYKALLATLQIGKCISASEVIRDFNGFSWSQIINEIESIECNAIYTDLLYLLGERYINGLNSTNIDKISKVVNSDLLNEIEQVALNFYLSMDKNQSDYMKKALKEDKEKLKKMKKQQKYIEDKSKRKRELLNQIKELDEELSDSKKLREEYVKLNKTLPNEKKIFSVSHFEERVQKQRQELLNELEECNLLQNPKEFIRIRTELTEKIKYYDNVNGYDLEDLQKVFFTEFSKQLENRESKDALIDYIYKIRYLKYLPISQDKKMMDIIDFEKLERDTLAKCLELDIVTPISKNIDIDYRLLKSIFITKNISIESLTIKLSVKDGKLYAEIYDGDVLDSTNYVELPKNSNIHIRKTKKVKIFA